MAVDAERRTAAAVARLDIGTVAVLAIGKAAPGMALGAAQVLGRRIERALLIAPGFSPASLPAHWTLHAGDHPLPGENSLAAGRVLFEWLAALPSRLPLLVLLSGGGSALVERPVDGMPVDALLALNRWLLAGGLDIHDMNAIRSRFSTIKRGGLLRAAGDRGVLGLVISDVPGDRVESIASGPLSPGPLAWPNVSLPPWLRRLHETLPLPGTHADRAARIEVIARNDDALDTIETAARNDGMTIALRGGLRGDAGECARDLATRIKSGPGGVYLWGGETSVSLPAAAGHGGRNQHLALAAAIELDAAIPFCLLALATDGIDGNVTDAGGLVDQRSAQRMRDAGHEPRDCLARADSGRALEAAGDLVHTGPTGTNVADIVIAFKP